MSGDQVAIDHKNAERLMCSVLEYYIKHHDVVLKKLDHARDATKKSINEIDVVSKASILDVPDEQKQEIQAYDDMWMQIIEHFRDSGVSEDELIKIEEILTKIPRLIKKYYDLLVEQDHVLQKLMEELKSDEYQEALEITENIQSRTDSLSGLSPHEFDSKEFERSFMLHIPSGKDVHH